jgi:uncharacterized protein (TIGR02246 family)
MLLGMLAASSVAAAAPAAVPGTQQCAPVTQAQVAALFDRWNASLATNDPAKVVANYAPDAVLLPTVSNTPRFTQDERRAYFVDFLKNKPQGVINDRRIMLGCNKAVDAGVYTFTMSASGATVPARYTYTYENRGGQWLITSHHSSAMPEKN